MRPNRPSWLASYGEDIAWPLAVLAAIALVCWLWWSIGVVLEQHEREMAAKERASIERAATMFHDGLCGDPRGRLADGSCE